MSSIPDNIVNPKTKLYLTYDGIEKLSNFVVVDNPLFRKIALYVVDLVTLPRSSIIKFNFMVYTLIARFFPIFTPKCVMLIA